MTARWAFVGPRETPAEEWRPIEGHPDYFVSNLGRVASNKQKKPRIVAQFVHGGPYLRVHLSQNNRGSLKRVHRLVAIAFHGPGGDGLEVRHLNGDPLDNRAVNLCWGTRSENLHDAVKHGTHHWAARTHCPKGHEYTPENTAMQGSRRNCRTCHRDRSRISQRRRRAAARGAA